MALNEERTDALVTPANVKSCLKVSSCGVVDVIAVVVNERKFKYWYCAGLLQ